VLDLGCGDGRFAQYLADRSEPVDYLGCDASGALLAHARGRGLDARYQFSQADFVAVPLARVLPAETFDLICVLGVMHHIPGRCQRQQLLRGLAQYLAPNGILALTIWRLDQDPRFASRIVPFEQYNRAAAQPIALEQLEPGDTLLRWGNPGGPPRYCHFPNPSEVEALLAASGLRLVERFQADGRGNQLNEYSLLAH
jgi:SAM-dependent methyltransferase